MGATGATMISFVAPALLYVRLFPAPRSAPKRVVSAAIVAFGVCAGGNPCRDGTWTSCACSLSDRPGIESRRGQLCAGLDFDMAFTADGFVDVAASPENGRVGADPADFANLLARERLNFAEVLAGGDCTSGVPQVALS